MALEWDESWDEMRMGKLNETHQIRCGCHGSQQEQTGFNIYIYK